MSKSSALKEQLRNILPKGSVVFQDDPAYSEKIATWNCWTSRKPFAVVQPRTALEVSNAVKAARALNIKQVTVRGGGHSFEALGLGGRDGALIIDMILMQEITTDPANKTITAQAGAHLGQLTVQAYESGAQMLPTGTCPGVGIGGQSQCGGYGFSVRTHGTLTDRVISYGIVTADGEIRTASKEENPDLFFALRGSGMGSFGVITSIVFRTNDAPAAMANFSLRWSFDNEHDIAGILKMLQKACVTAPLTANPMVIGWLGMLEVAGCLLTDTASERDKIFQDFLSQLPKPDETSFEPMNAIDSVIHIEQTQTSAPWYDSVEDIKREGEEYLRIMKIKAGFVPNLLSDDFLERFAEKLKTQPRTGVRTQLLKLNPDIEYDRETTSIKNRGCEWLFGESVWLTAKEWGRENLEAEAAKRLPWLEEMYELFYPVTTGGYLGDDDFGESEKGRDMFESYYGQHLGKLSDVKRRFDPGNLFNHPLSVPL